MPFLPDDFFEPNLVFFKILFNSFPSVLEFKIEVGDLSEAQSNKLTNSHNVENETSKMICLTFFL